MKPTIVFVPSAFKHGVNEENIRWVLEYHLAENAETKYIAVGFDKAGNLLEVMYNYVDEKIVKVFYAMKCRKQFRKDLGIEE